MLAKVHHHGTHGRRGQGLTLEGPVPRKERLKMAKDRILITATNYSKYCARAKKLLEDAGYELIENAFGRPMTFDELKVRVPGVRGVVVGVDTWNEEVFKLAPELRVMSRFGIGVDNIDLAAAKARGIKVTNARGDNADSVAECVVALILALYRDVVGLDASTRRGRWDRYVGNTIRGKKVGLVGFGAIAQYVARLLSAFGATIVAYDLFRDEAAAKRLGVSFVDLDALIEQSDIVSLHVPATPETTRLIGERQLGRMKKTAILINTARGAVVDQGALCAALKERRIAGAGIDVFEKEPTDASNPLFALDNVVVTPHSAAETYETYDAVSIATATAIMDVLNGKEPKNWLNR
jgi:D-3-phosphoglycerate dehydrogenase / 2-oxoglutarate reductase